VTIRSLGNYAGLSAGQGNYEEAEALMKRCITLSDELLNGEHDEAHANSVFNLAQFYIARHRPVEARPLLESLLQPGQRFPQHLTIKEVKMNLARAYRQCREVRGANNGKVSSQIGREQVKQLPIQRRALAGVAVWGNSTTAVADKWGQAPH